MKHRLVLLPAAGLALLVLAGCTATETSTAASTPTPSVSAGPSGDAASSSDYVPPKLTAECVDGTATITEDSAVVSLGDCENVVVDASNTVVNVRNTTTITMTKSISLVNADRVADVVFVGNGNTVATDSSPVVDDRGEDNLLGPGEPAADASDG